MSVGVDGRWGCFGNSYPECRTQQRERSTIEESRKRVLRLRFKFGVIGGNDSGVGVFVSIMNGLISRRLHNPEIDVTTDDGATVAETAVRRRVGRPALLVVFGRDRLSTPRVAQ